MNKQKNVIKRKSNSEIESGYEKSQEQINSLAMLRYEQKKSFVTRTDKIAQDFESYKKWIFKNAREHFPDEPWMRTVDLYYPNSFCGPLLIDTPEIPQDEKRCEEKRAVLESLGYRYLIIKPNMTDVECFTEIEACGQRLKKQSMI